MLLLGNKERVNYKDGDNEKLTWLSIRCTLTEALSLLEGFE